MALATVRRITCRGNSDSDRLRGLVPIGTNNDVTCPIRTRRSWWSAGRSRLSGRYSRRVAVTGLRSNPSVNADARDVPAPASDRDARAGGRER